LDQLLALVHAQQEARLVCVHLVGPESTGEVFVLFKFWELDHCVELVEVLSSPVTLKWRVNAHLLLSEDEQHAPDLFKGLLLDHAR